MSKSSLTCVCGRASPVCVVDRGLGMVGDHPHLSSSCCCAGIARMPAQQQQGFGLPYTVTAAVHTQPAVGCTAFVVGLWQTHLHFHAKACRLALYSLKRAAQRCRPYGAVQHSSSMVTLAGSKPAACPYLVACTFLREALACLPDCHERHTPYL